MYHSRSGQGTGVDSAPLIPLVLPPLKTREVDTPTPIITSSASVTGDGGQAWVSASQKLAGALWTLPTLSNTRTLRGLHPSVFSTWWDVRKPVPVRFITFMLTEIQSFLVPEFSNRHTRNIYLTEGTTGKYGSMCSSWGNRVLLMTPTRIAVNSELSDERIIVWWRNKMEMTLQLTCYQREWRVVRERYWKIVMIVYLLFLDIQMPRPTNFQFTWVHKLSHCLELVFHALMEAQWRWQCLQCFVIGKSRRNRRALEFESQLLCLLGKWLNLSKTWFPQIKWRCAIRSYRI